MKLLACQIEVPEVTTKAGRRTHVASLAERISFQADRLADDAAHETRLYRSKT